MNIKKHLFLLFCLLVIISIAGCANADKKQVTKETENVEQTKERVIGIIGAMEEEIEILRDKMKVEDTEKVAGMVFHKGKLGGENIVLVRSGVGKVNAATCTQALIDHFGVDYIINSGVAGGVDPKIKVGDIVISKDAVQHDMDVTALGEKPGAIPRMNQTYFEADAKLIKLANGAAKGLSEDINIHLGRIASGDQFIASAEKKENIINHFSPYAVEMEGAAIAHVAYLNKVPFVIIRSISDDASSGAEMKYEDFVKLAAKNASYMIEHMLKNAKESL